MTRPRLYGTWPSSISAADAADSAGFPTLAWDSDGTTLLWLENRAGNSALMAQTDADAPQFLTDGPVSIGGGINYGGGDFTAAHGSAYYVLNRRQIVRQPIAGGHPMAISPPYGAAAAPVVSPDGRFVVYVHHHEGRDCLMVADTAGAHSPRTLAAGDDFYMQPAFSADGSQLAYIAWNHPHMPFDATRLRLARLELAAGMPAIVSQHDLAGGDDHAAMQPIFAADGRLAYISDASGWAQVYIYDPASGQTRQLTHAEAEHAAPPWQQGQRSIAWSADGTALYALRNADGRYSLWLIDAASGAERRITSLDDYSFMAQLDAAPDRDAVAMIAGSPTLPERVLSVQIDRAGAADRVRIHARTRSEINRAAWATGEPVTWAGHDGGAVHGWLYRPHNPDFTDDGAPPLIVSVHGGPTAQSRQGFDPRLQFFTSRGFAWLEVNHRGSTGHGKAYKDALRGAWGITDVEDSASGALAMVERGLADRARLAISGGSAGGYTVLQSLVSKPGLYAAGLCRYGIGNPITLAFHDTWKFESRYNDTLFGPLPGSREAYRARSPLFFAERVTDPVLLLHGEDDEVVPVSETRDFAAALRRHGVPHELHTYPGEGHGFRKPETIIHMLETSLRFLLAHVILK